ncbi:GNAT family N-acetyltransferase [Leptolyngbya sp. NK1-12]|uniref:GNAT family N-acetyltransferase n=1 Tax=Leptolyngbya sp. NK1-12 TaxID=2547451 RepID=A0AA96WI80_9CYAN|nr:GNAT family protein [Leptolyngbya sp. NK1-12]WNZ25798.1 GNAT family N-acetyltransferase [Leptolyngbya sp. NK1-12]
MSQHRQLGTNRLLLRLISHADAPSIQTAASIREVADAMISIPHPYPEGEAEQYVSEQIAKFEAGHSVAFVIERKAEKAFCGMIEIRGIELEHSQAELSFWLAVEMWGQGYMSEALKPVLRFAFETLNLNRLYAYHMVRNPASGKVLQKNGFTQEGLLRQRVRKWGVFEDAKLWAILRQDWRNQTASCFAADGVTDAAIASTYLAVCGSTKV